MKWIKLTSLINCPWKAKSSNTIVFSSSSLCSPGEGSCEANSAISFWAAQKAEGKSRYLGPLITNGNPKGGFISKFSSTPLLPAIPSCLSFWFPDWNPKTWWVWFFMENFWRVLFWQNIPVKNKANTKSRCIVITEKSCQLKRQCIQLRFQHWDCIESKPPEFKESE